MAIKKKEEKKKDIIPDRLAPLLTKAFNEQFLCNKFEGLFKTSKGEILDYIENNKDGFSITQGESVACEEGIFYYTETTRQKIDVDKVIDLIEKKKVTLAQVLTCVSTWKNEDLEKALSTPVFKTVATASTSSSFTMKANAEFKAKAEEDFNSAGSFKLKEHDDDEEVKGDPMGDMKVDRAEMIAAKATKKASSKKTTKIEHETEEVVAVKKTKTKVSVDEDLDAILNS